jgi:1-acyl-sn-glycerol-3-phosphate acyltransferase
MMRTLFGIIVLLILTPICGSIVLVASLLGLKDHAGSVFDRMPNWWANAILWAAGVKVIVHGDEHRSGTQHVFVANHISWFDVLVMAASLRWFKFVAKAELQKIPLFGRAAAAAGTVYIQRENRKAAFDAYREAAEKIKEGASVIVFAEGTRGEAYPLRHFKKGPFVLAIRAQAPIVPTVIHGTLRVQPRGRLRVEPGEVHVHFLEPVPTAGLDYEQRDQLAVTVRDRMAACLEREYGVTSEVILPRRAMA